MPFLDILIFAAIALFLIFRLRSILGSRDGFEQKRDNLHAFRPEAANDTDDDQGDGTGKVVSLHGSDKPFSGTGLSAVRQADSSFRDDEFMNGASAAFGMILEAFADGDLASLRRLLSYELYQEFASSVHDRNKRGEQLSITVSEISDVQLADGEVDNNIASVTVQFVSRQTRHVNDKQGHLIEEESETDITVTDIWVFERDTNLSDPNWKLVETRTPEGA